MHNRTVLVILNTLCQSSVLFIIEKATIRIGSVLYSSHNYHCAVLIVVDSWFEIRIPFVLVRAETKIWTV